MNNALPTITRTALDSGKFRYEVDGKVHTAASKVAYTHASVYYTNDPADLIVCLHKTEAAAAKGSPDGNRYWNRIPGVAVIAEA